MKRPRRRGPAEGWVWFAVLVGSVFALGWWTGSATAASSCNRVYKAPPVIAVDFLGRAYYASPVSRQYVLCLRANPCTLETPCSVAS